MTAPQTSADAATGTAGAPATFSPDVVAFAAAHQAEGCLLPLLEATHRIFPTARSVCVQIDDDPEIRDERHILYNVQVAGLGPPESRTAARRWNEESFRICPAPLVSIFRLRMELKS